MLTELIMVIVLQYVHTSDHYVVQLKLVRCHMSIISPEYWENL